MNDGKQEDDVEDQDQKKDDTKKGKAAPTIPNVGDVDNNQDSLKFTEPAESDPTEQPLQDEYGQELDQSGLSGRVAPAVPKPKKS